MIDRAEHHMLWQFAQSIINVRINKESPVRVARAMAGKSPAHVVRATAGESSHLQWPCMAKAMAGKLPVHMASAMLGESLACTASVMMGKLLARGEGNVGQVVDARGMGN